MAAVRSVLEEVHATDVPLIDVYNKCDLLTPDQRRRLRQSDPDALCISAIAGRGGGRDDGLAELVATMASRLALDVRRVTLTIASDDPAGPERIARLYRHARVLVHESRDTSTVMVADVPRRLLDSLGLPAPEGRNPLPRRERGR
jgi:50S ribosomal subunit-associated GTPase HflX